MAGQVTVTPLEPGDYALAADWLGDRDINKWLYAEWRERPVSEQLIALAANNPRNRMWLFQVDGEPYGLGAVGNISATDRSGVIWYLRGNHGRRVPGAMTRAVEQMAREAFTSLNLRSLSASVQAGNTVSESLLRAAGFRRVGIMRKAFATDDGFVDRVVFDLLPEDPVRNGPR